MRCCLATLAIVGALRCLAQNSAGQVAPTQAPTTRKPLPTFDVASVKPSRPDSPYFENIPLGVGTIYTPTGGHFSAKGVPLTRYMSFAFLMTNNQRLSFFPKLPGWANEARFDIEARVEGNPTKDEMRLMMQSLLIDRFKLAIHTERREVPVLEFVLVKPGKTGPKLRPHSEGVPCPDHVSFQETVANGFPSVCGGMTDMVPEVRGHRKTGARDLPLDFIAEAMSVRANLGRPLKNHTGLEGTFDFVIDWVPDPPPGAQPPGNDPAEPSGPSFVEALRDQLGIKLESGKGFEDIYVLDHIEHLDPN